MLDRIHHIEEEIKAFEAEIHAFVGQVVYPETPAADDVNEAMIRQWAEILGETLEDQI